MRTKRFALDAIRLVSTLSKNQVNDVIGRQFLKSATPIGANYREAVYAESRNDFAHKISIVTKEVSETQYWLELLAESGANSGALRDLSRECGELLKIFVSSGKTVRSRH